MEQPIAGQSTGSQPDLAGPSKRGRYLLLALWVFFVCAYLATFVLHLSLGYRQISTPCAGPDCNYQAITAAEAAALAGFGFSTPASAARAYAAYVHSVSIVIMTIYLVLAVIMLVRLYPRRSGFLFSLILIVFPAALITDFDVIAQAYPGLELLVLSLSVTGIGLIVLFFVIFPNGRPAPRWSLLLPIAGALLALFFVFDLAVIVLSLLLIILCSSIGVVVYRYRRLFDYGERQQTKWVLLGLALVPVGIAVWVFTYELAVPPPGQARVLRMLVGWTLSTVCLLALPATIFIAIVRYRLWDVDLIIRRTLLYGALTALLALIYFGAVLLLQNILTALTGQQSPIAIVLSTLLIAALFTPARRWLQAAIDRRFFRRKYDAARTLAQFAATVNDEVDLDQMRTELLRVVQTTVQPEIVTMWLKEQ